MTRCKECGRGTDNPAICRLCGDAVCRSCYKKWPTDMLCWRCDQLERDAAWDNFCATKIPEEEQRDIYISDM